MVAAMDVLIRPPASSDRDEFLAAVHASRELHGEWMQPPDTAGSFDRYLGRSRDERMRCFLVRLAGSGELAGVVNASEVVRGHFQSAYLGFYAFAPHAGRGVMTRGLTAVLERLFGEEGLHRVEANVQPGNQRSLALVKRLGFRREGFSPRYLEVAGRWCDHERWALLADEWSGSAGKTSVRDEG